MSENLVGRYEVRAEIGRGGLGVVYTGWDPVIGREVAVKLINVGPLDERESGLRRQWVLREARAAGVLSHSSIVAVYDAGEQGEYAFIVMELVKGRSLAGLLERQKRLAAEEAFPILRQCAAALDYAHGKGIYHRDIKPANVLIEEGGAAKLADFGLARMETATKLTQTGAMLGTPQYMSPEQLQGLPVKGASDQFSLAVMTIEMLTGDLPWESEALIFQILNANPPSVAKSVRALPTTLDPVIAKAMAKKPGDRFGDCTEFVAKLEAAYTQKRTSRPYLWAGLGTAVVALAAVGFVWFRPSTTPVPPLVQQKPIPSKIVLPEAKSSAPAVPVPKSSPPAVQAKTQAPPPALPSPRPQPQPATPPEASSGTIVWSGTLAAGEEVTINRTECTNGQVTRELPGKPVRLRVTPASLQLTESPSAENGWKRFRVRNTGREVDTFIVTYALVE